MKIAVLVDSGSGLTKKQAEAMGIFYLPLQIFDDDAGKTYLDGIDVDGETVFQMLKEGKMMKTSLPPVWYMEELFTKLEKEGYEHVIAVTLTSGLSSTMQTVKMTAENHGLNINCIETYTTCDIQAYIAKAAQGMVNAGVELDMIIARLYDSIAHSDTLIIPDDLDHLAKGGRLTPMAAALGGMLKIKPILRLDKESDGKIDTYDKVRTMKKAIKTAVKSFRESEIDENYHLVLLHTCDPDSEEVKLLKHEFFDKYPDNTSKKFGYIGPVISCHTGVGCLGIQYIKKI